MDNWKWSYVGLLGALGGVALVFEVYTWIKFCLIKVKERKQGSKDQKSEAVEHVTVPHESLPQNNR